MLGGPAAVERFSPDGEKAQESLARTKPRGPFTLRFFPHRMLKHQKKKPEVCDGVAEFQDTVVAEVRRVVAR